MLITCIIKIISPVYFLFSLSVVTRKVKMAYVVHIIFILDKYDVEHGPLTVILSSLSLSSPPLPLSFHLFTVSTQILIPRAIKLLSRAYKSELILYSQCLTSVIVHTVIF